MKFPRLLFVLVLLVCGELWISCGGGEAPALPTPVPTPLPTPDLPIIMAAGDISCDSATPLMPCKSLETSDLIRSQFALRDAVVVLPLGDLQYDAGTLAEFNKNYETTWGRLNQRAHPVPGNHEYLTTGARGYFDYFASRGVAVGNRNEGWYQYDVAGWHFIALNSNCEQIGGCNSSSAQYRWLVADLTANKSKCTVAYMHYPFLSSGANGNNPQILPMIQLLYDNSVDIVLAGHDHNYERFFPMTPQGVRDPVRGLRLFVVGTGGRDQTDFKTQLPSSDFRTKDHFGALRIVMKDGAYDWQFVSATDNGRIVDNGAGICF
ncbi:MAG: metallophosphoesterase [Vicinamibacteria bacterium]